MISLLTPARRMFRSIRVAWPSSSSIMMIVRGRCLSIFWSFRAGSLPRHPEFRKRQSEDRAATRRFVEQEGATDPPGEAPRMGQADALARLVLDTGAAEEIKHAFAVGWTDAAAVIDDVDAMLARRFLGPDFDPSRHIAAQILQRVVEQIGEDLLDRHAIAADHRQLADHQLRLRLSHP